MIGRKIRALSNFLRKNGLEEEAEEIEQLSKPTIDLSEFEESELGTQRESQTYPVMQSKEDWLRLRDRIVEKKQKSRSYKQTDTFGPLDPELTAYTPGETLGLLAHPKILEWHNKMANYKISEEYKTIVFVPCAASKPWGPSHCSGHYYPAYNKIRKDIEEGRLHNSVFFVTISEPLGVVPQDMWDEFPAYDNPGLFGNDPQRTGMFTKDWNESEFGQRYMIPFDPEAKTQAIKALGDVIADFVQGNQLEGRRWISFIESKDMKTTTHSLMLDSAQQTLEEGVVPQEGRHPKTDPAKRPGWKSTYQHMKGILEKPVGE